MRRFKFALAAADRSPSVAIAAPAAAITNNYVEDNVHTYVGLIAFYDEAGEFAHRCSGSLLSPTVFLTAGHCTDDGAGGVNASARVWFQQDAGAHYDPATQHDPVSGYPDECAAGTLGVVVRRRRPRCTTTASTTSPGFPDTKDAGRRHPRRSRITVVEVRHGGAASGPWTPCATHAAQACTSRSAATASATGQVRRRPCRSGSRLMATSTLVNLNAPYNAGSTSRRRATAAGAVARARVTRVARSSSGDTDVNRRHHLVRQSNAGCRGTDFDLPGRPSAVQDFIAESIGD